MRRAVVKMRFTLINGNLQSANAHLRYLQREGTQRDGSRGVLYSASEDAYEPRSFIARCIEDRHQFRLVVSPEDGDCYDELRPLVRGFMGAMEKDLGTSLQWAAVDHSNTAHPHAHIILRGRDDIGNDLIIAREYVRHGMCARLAELVTRDLGPCEDWEPGNRLRQEIEAERLTNIDRDLLRTIDAEGLVEPGSQDPFKHALRVGRLRKLERLGFAEPFHHGRWRLSTEVDRQLRALGDRTELTSYIEHALEAEGLDRPRSSWVVGEPVGANVVGQVIGRGIRDEDAGRQFLLIDGVDGRVHHLAVGASDLLDHVPEQSIVRVERGSSPGNEITVLSPVGLKRLPSWNGLTWLDRQLAGIERGQLRDCGFGAEVQLALAARGQWLIDEELAVQHEGQLQFRASAFAVLRERELSAVTARLQAELGKHCVALEEAVPFNATLSRRVDLASGRFALFENSREFSLVPWHSDFQREIGREIGRMSFDGLEWRMNRGRELSIE